MAPADPDALVARDRAAMLYAHGLAGLAVTAAASACLVPMVVSPSSQPGLLAWLGAMGLVLIGRGVDTFVLHPARCRNRFDARREMLRFGMGVMAVALVWAIFPIAFFPVISDAGRMAAAIVLAALAGGSATVLGPSMPLAIAYCTALLAPASAEFLRLPGRENHVLGSLGLAMLAAMVVSSRVANRTVVKALRLSRINQALVAEADRQRAATESVNRELAGAQVALREANDLLEHRIAARTADLAREVGERQRYADALARLAAMDPLTGLANRTTFAERLARMLAEAERRGTALAVLFLDLDNFKQVNDVRGHATGDRVLQAAAALLSQRAGGAVELARWGGDEFVMAMPTGYDPAAARQMAEELRRALAGPLSAGLETVRIDMTVGIACFPGDGRTQDELIRAADVAMYEAKKEGKGRIKLFDPALARNVAERHTLEQALRDAVRNGELSLVYQPIIAARTGRCEAFEALLRWHHPQLGAISPVHFIPIAEQSGQIGAIGRWVLQEACAAAAGWPGEAPAVTVNVSVAQVLSGVLLDDVAAALAQSGLPASRLSLEITESMFVGDHLRVTPVFDELRRRGLRILLDDFGTGFSSLAYLGKLPLDVIKIDQSFVRVAERDGYAVIRAILSIARALLLEVTAEGVETEDQQRTLCALGVERLQGFLLGQPMPREAVAPWLAAHRPFPQPRPACLLPTHSFSASGIARSRHILRPEDAEPGAVVGV
jgi:diguanylate cyclase (GGDEF)-like protein